HLKTLLLVVLGHEGCGAVAAALEVLDLKVEEPRFIAALTALIEPGLKGIDPKLRDSARLSAAVESNVRWSARQITGQPEAQRALEEKRVALATTVYDLGTGRVRFLE